MPKLEIATGRGIKLERAYFRKYDETDKIPVMFNPTELSIKKTVPWDAQPKPKEEPPKQQFTSGQAKTLSVKLDFDSSGFNRPDGSGIKEALDIRVATGPIMALAEVPGDSDEGHPPLLAFEWGEGIQFICVIKSVNVTFTKFNPQGLPIRANMQVELLEAKPDEYAEYTGDDCTSGTITTADDGSTAASLSGSSSEEQQKQWRSVADQSSSDNPRECPAGESYQTS